MFVPLYILFEFISEQYDLECILHFNMKTEINMMIVNAKIYTPTILTLHTSVIHICTHLYSVQV